jgi:hypothetical protein
MEVLLEGRFHLSCLEYIFVSSLEIGVRITKKFNVVRKIFDFMIFSGETSSISFGLSLTVFASISTSKVPSKTK